MVFAFPLIGEINASNEEHRIAVYNRGMRLHDVYVAVALHAILSSGEDYDIAAEQAVKQANRVMSLRKDDS